MVPPTVSALSLLLLQMFERSLHLFCVMLCSTCSVWQWCRAPACFWGGVLKIPAGEGWLDIARRQGKQGSTGKLAACVFYRTQKGMFVMKSAAWGFHGCVQSVVGGYIFSRSDSMSADCMASNQKIVFFDVVLSCFSLVFRLSIVLPVQHTLYRRDRWPLFFSLFSVREAV